MNGVGLADSCSRNGEAGGDEKAQRRIVQTVERREPSAVGIGEDRRDEPCKAAQGEDGACNPEPRCHEPLSRHTEIHGNQFALKDDEPGRRAYEFSFSMKNQIGKEVLSGSVRGVVLT